MRTRCGERASRASSVGSTTSNGVAVYGSGDAKGRTGVWFAGRWRTAAAESYISALDDNLARRIWETPEFAYP